MAQVTKPPVLDETGKKIADTLTSIANSLASPSGLDARYSANITKENIDEMFIEWWAQADNGDFTKTQLLARWFNLLISDKIYGVKTYNYADSVSSDGVLTDDSVELGVCTPATEVSEGVDNFCKEKAFWTVEVNYEIDANGEIEIKAVDGIHSDFTRAGTAGMVGVAQKSAFYFEDNDGTYNILKYSTKKYAGYKPLPECVSPVDNSLRPFMVHAKYCGGIGPDGKATSATGLAPMNYSYSHNSQIAKWRERGAKYSGVSSCDVKFTEKMFRLKYAKKGNSSTMAGCNSYYLEYRPAVAESNVTRVILTTAQASNLVVGSWLSVGATSRSSGNTLPAVKIKSIKTVTIGGTSYSAVYLDTRTLISPTTEWYVSTIPWGSGSCDRVKGVDGSPNLTNGKYPFIIQGIECQTGGYLILADTIMSEVYADGVNTITPKICKKASNITTSPSTNYDDGTVFTVAGTSAGWRYIQDVNDEGDDILTPKAVDGGAGSSNGYQSAIYSPIASGNYECLVWGILSIGGDCGLACMNVNLGVTGADWDIVAGASGSGANRGEWSD